MRLNQLHGPVLVEMVGRTRVEWNLALSRDQRDKLRERMLKVKPGIPPRKPWRPLGPVRPGTKAHDALLAKVLGSDLVAVAS